MSQFNNFKQWIFENLFPAFYQTNDTYKDEEGKGIIQRFIEVCAEYFDNEVQPDIDTAMDNIDFDKTQLIFLNQLWEYFDCIPYAYGVLVNNEKYDPENIQRWFNSALGFPKADPRRILRYAISLFKIRGTSRFYQILGRFYGVEISLESVEVSGDEIERTEYGPIVLIQFTYLDQSESVYIPAEGVTNLLPTIEWYQEYTVYYKSGEVAKGTVYNNGTTQFRSFTSTLEGHVNATTGEIDVIEPNDLFINVPLGSINLTITANDQSLEASVNIILNAKEDYIIESVPVSITLSYSDMGDNPKTYISLDASNSPVYPQVIVKYSDTMASGTPGEHSTLYQVTPDNPCDDLFKFTDESELGFMGDYGIVSADATDDERLLATSKVEYVGYPDITDTTEVWQRSDYDIVFTEVSLSYDDILASGGTVSPHLTIIASVDGSDPRELDIDEYTLEWSGVAVDNLGAVSAASRERVVGDRWIVDHVTVTIHAYGKTISVSADVYQQENVIQYLETEQIIGSVFQDYHLKAGAGSTPPDFGSDARVTLQESYTSGYIRTSLTYWLEDDPELTFHYTDLKGWVNENTGVVTVDGQISSNENVSIDTVTVDYYQVECPDGVTRQWGVANATAQVYQEVSGGTSPSLTLSPSSAHAEININYYEGGFTLTTNSNCNLIDLVAIPWGVEGSADGYVWVTLNGKTYTADTDSISLSTNTSYEVTYRIATPTRTSPDELDYSLYFTPHYGSESTGDTQEYEISIVRS